MRQALERKKKAVASREAALAPLRSEVAAAASFTSGAHTPPVGARAPPPVDFNMPLEILRERLVSAQTAAAFGEASISYWQERVRIGEAPQPAVRAERFTRWTLGSVLDYWASLGKGNANAGDQVMDKAVRASAAAGEARRAKAKRESVGTVGATA